ncbi:hypothetical protein ACL02S_06530 [Nocardia sp. 004]|uniref:helix-turn-helix domain-containing protein n=1 Tax=Nocardia sp. 004 TaxID=3385978 RepID=UPI0039A21216
MAAAKKKTSTPNRLLFAELLTVERETAGLTRSRIAGMCHVSYALVYAWETAQRIPDGEHLQLWFEAVQMPAWKRPKIISVLHEAISLVDRQALETISWPVLPVWTPEDQVAVDRILDPCCCHDRFTFDLWGCNQRFLDRFPGLVPASSDSDPSNLLIWTFTNPLARKVIQNWPLRARLMAASFGTLSPGEVPQRRIDEIKQACSSNPEFEAMYRSRPTDAEITNQEVVLYDPDIEQFVTYSMRASAPKYPPRPWDLLVLQAPI